MAGPSAPEQGIPTKETSNVVELTANHHEQLSNKVTAELQKGNLIITEKDVVPAATQPIPPHPALEQVKAERVGAAEVPMNLNDFKHGVATMGAALGAEDQHTFTRTISSRKGSSGVLDRVKQLKAA